MKKIIPLIVVAAVSSTSLQAATSYGSATYKDAKHDTITTYGSSDLKEVEVGKLDVFGSADIADSKITTGTFKGSVHVEDSRFLKDVKINGSIHAKKTLFSGELLAHGSVKCDECKFEKATKVYGALKAEKSQFSGLMTVYSTKVDFEEVAAENIVVDVNKTESETPELHLEESTVSGNITFKNKPGIVYVDSKTTIKGQVINGRIEHG